MNLTKSELVFIAIVLVIPGFISQAVFNSLVARGKERQLDIYQSVIHSVLIYVMLYTLVVLFFGVEVVKPPFILTLLSSKSWAPLVLLIVVGIASAAWGIVYSKIFRSNALKGFLSRFGASVEPPNVYALLLDNNYKDVIDPDQSYWLTFKIEDNKFLEGCVEVAALKNQPREVFLTKVAYLDEHGNIIKKLEPNMGIIINVDKYDIAQLTIGTKEKNATV